MMRRPGHRVQRIHVVIATLALSVTAGASAVAATSGGGHQGLAPAIDPAGSPHAAAVAEVHALLAAAPTLDSATRVPTAPIKLLRQPPTELGNPHLVWRARYWTADMSWTTAYQHLTSSTPAGMKPEGTGSSGGPRGEIRYAAYQPQHLPAHVSWAEMIVAVGPRGSHSAVGVYAEAVPQPIRPAAEHVPSDTRDVVVKRLKDTDHPTARSVTLGATRAAALVHDFNAMKVDDGTVRHCPVALVGSPVRAAFFRTPNHTWRATEATCGFVQVQRDGHTLPALDETGAFARDLRHDLASQSADTSRSQSSSKKLPSVAGTSRPAAERVPLSVHRVVVERQSIRSASERHVLGHDRRRHLARLFDELNVWPPDRVQCEIATTTQQVVKFRTHHHTWLTQVGAACRGMTVSRDGHALPMLVPTTAWEDAINRILND